MSSQLMLHVTLTLSETNSGVDGWMVGQAHMSDVEGDGDGRQTGRHRNQPPDRISAHQSQRGQEVSVPALGIDR